MLNFTMHICLQIGYPSSWMTPRSFLDIQNAPTLPISSVVFSENKVVVSHPSVSVYTMSALCRCLTSRTERAHAHDSLKISGLVYFIEKQLNLT